MALDRLTKVDGGGISTTSDYRVGIITATKFVGPIEGDVTGSITATDGTFSGNVTIGGTLTYEDVTNIDSVGIITARDGIHVGAGISVVGVGSFGSLDISGDLDVDGHTNLDNVSIAGVTTFADNIDLQRASASNIRQLGTGPLQIRNEVDDQDVVIQADNGSGGTTQYFRADGSDGGAKLYHYGSIKFETISTGAQVTGNLNVSQDLDVDGHTNLDNVSIAGVTTTTGNLNVTDGRILIAQSSGPQIRINSSAADGSSTRFTLGLATGSNNFINGAVANDACVTAPQEIKFGIGNGLSLRIQNDKIITNVDLIPSANNLRSLGLSNYRWTDLYSVDANISGDLDVDGHTNLDNVSIAGVTTTAGALNVANIFQVGTTIDTGELRIGHDGSNFRARIVSNSANSLTIDADGPERIQMHGGVIYMRPLDSEKSAAFVANGPAELYHNDIKTAFTDVDQWKVYGRTSNSGMVEIASNQGANNNDRFRIHKTSAASRLTIQNYSTGSWIENIRITAGGAVELKHADGTTKFQTTANGAAISNIANNHGLDLNGVGNNTCIKFLSTGSSPAHGYRIAYHSTTNYVFNSPAITFDKIATNGNFSNHIAAISDSGFHLPDNKKLHIGGAINASSATGDLQIYHDTAVNRIDSDGHIVSIRNTSGGTANMVRLVPNEAAELFYDGTKRFSTSGIGVTVIGEVAASQDYPNFRPTLDFNFAATKKLKPEMTFTRQGEASFHDGVGSVKFVSDNEPRFEHDILTGECKGLMFEGAGTNYSWYSRRFDVVATSSWVKVNSASITGNTHTAPDGTSSGIYMADTISGANGNTFNGNVLRQQITAGANVKHTFSIYIKLLTSTQATIYIRDGATGSTASANAVNVKGWQRVVVTSNNALTNATAHSFYVGNTNGDIAVWGAQIERSDYVTSYIKTEGAANGTRNTDKGVHLDGEDVTDVFNDGRGTLIAEAILTQSQSNNPIVGFYEDFASNNRLELRGDASSTGVARLEAIAGGSLVASLTTNLQHSGVNNVSKYAYAFQENNYAGCVNGGSVGTDTAGAFPSGINSMMIGEAVYQVDAAVIVKRIMYYADRLPNSQLVTLTS